MFVHLTHIPKHFPLQKHTAQSEAGAIKIARAGSFGCDHVPRPKRGLKSRADEFS